MQAVLEKQYEMDKIRAVLEGFRLLSPAAYSQKHGFLYESHMESENEECGACVGAWSAYFLNIPLKEDESLPEGPFWCFAAGALALANTLKVTRTQLENVLSNHGADEEPFGSWSWPRNPYAVLCDTVKEITGYDHEEYLRGLPVPLKGDGAHKVLEAMP